MVSHRAQALAEQIGKATDRETMVAIVDVQSVDKGLLGYNIDLAFSNMAADTIEAVAQVALQRAFTFLDEKACDCDVCTDARKRLTDAMAILAQGDLTPGGLH